MASHLRTLLLVCACCAPCFSVNAQATQAWSGRWLVDEGIRALESRRDAAVRTATASMNMVVRRIARRRLRRRAPLPHHVSIGGEGSSFRAHVGHHLLNFPADGSRHTIRGQRGNSLVASQRLQGRRLRQVIRGNGGTLTHTLVLSEDGQRLTLRVRIASAQLPQDVTYELTFRRS